jgi:hypothetical protein
MGTAYRFDEESNEMIGQQELMEIMADMYSELQEVIIEKGVIEEESIGKNKVEKS